MPELSFPGAVQCEDIDEQTVRIYPAFGERLHVLLRTLPSSDAPSHVLPPPLHVVLVYPAFCKVAHTTARPTPVPRTLHVVLYSTRSTTVSAHSLRPPTVVCPPPHRRDDTVEQSVHSRALSHVRPEELSL
jgi:hypothetical protein